MKNYLYLILLVSCINCYSQTMNLGFKYEPFYLYANVNREEKIIASPYGFHIFAGKKFNDKIAIELQSGIVLVKNIYGGAEIGIAGKYFPLRNRVYLTSGFWSIFQIGGLTDSQGFDKIHYLGSIGFGTYLSDIFLLELSYQFPIANKIVDETVIWNPYDFRLNKYIKSTMKSIIKLGIGVSFDL